MDILKLKAMKNSRKYEVLIDGVKDTLTLVYRSGGGYQYNTNGNKSAHTFKYPLQNMPTKFINSGHEFEILKAL